MKLTKAAKDWLKLTPQQRVAAVVRYAEFIDGEEWRRFSNDLELVHTALNTGDLKLLNKLGLIEPTTTKS